MPATPGSSRIAWIVSTQRSTPACVSWPSGTLVQAAFDLVGQVDIVQALEEGETVDRGYRADADQDGAAPVEAAVAHRLHPAPEALQVENVLRLDELGASLDLGRKPVDPMQVSGRSVLNAADQPLGRSGKVTAGKQVLLLQPLRRPNRGQRVEIEDVEGARLVAMHRRVAGLQHDVGDADAGGAEQVRLQAEAVSVAALQQHDRLHAGAHHSDAACPAREPCLSTLTVGHGSCVNPVVDLLRLTAQRLQGRAARWRQLTGHGELAALDTPGEATV